MNNNENVYDRIKRIATHGRVVSDFKSKKSTEDYSEIMKRIGYLTDKISDGRLNKDTIDKYKKELEELLRRERYAKY